MDDIPDIRMRLVGGFVVLSDAPEAVGFSAAFTYTFFFF